MPYPVSNTIKYDLNGNTFFLIYMIIYDLLTSDADFVGERANSSIMNNCSSLLNGPHFESGIIDSKTSEILSNLQHRQISTQSHNRLAMFCFEMKTVTQIWTSAGITVLRQYALTQKFFFSNLSNPRILRVIWGN